LKNTARNDSLTLDTVASRVADNDMNNHHSIATHPGILAFIKSSRRVLAFCSQGTDDYFSEKMGWGQIQQLGHEADNSPSSHDVIKLRLNFHPSTCF